MSAALLKHPPPRTHVARLVTRCRDCGRLANGREATCERCGGEALEQVSPVGEIYSYTTVRHATAPFVLALVQLSSGQLVTARIVATDRQLRIGLPVEFASGPALLAETEVAGPLFLPTGGQLRHATGRSK
jgi:uncharacterized OB-fold protein